MLIWLFLLNVWIWAIGNNIECPWLNNDYGGWWCFESLCFYTLLLSVILIQCRQFYFISDYLVCMDYWTWFGLKTTSANSEQKRDYCSIEPIIEYLVGFMSPIFLYLLSSLFLCILCILELIVKNLFNIFQIFGEHFELKNGSNDK